MQRYTLARPKPPLEIRQAIKKMVPRHRQVPPNVKAYLYSPSPFLISIPAIGGPVKFAKLMIEYTMPILVPAFRKSVVRDDKAAGKSP